MDKIIALLLTIIIELMIILLICKKNKLNNQVIIIILIMSIIINCLTNIPMNWILERVTNTYLYFFLLGLFEIIIVIFEGLCYFVCLNNLKSSLFISFISNLCSFVLGTTILIIIQAIVENLVI